MMDSKGAERGDGAYFSPATFPCNDGILGRNNESSKFRILESSAFDRVSIKVNMGGKQGKNCDEGSDG